MVFPLGRNGLSQLQRCSGYGLSRPHLSKLFTKRVLLNQGPENTQFSIEAFYRSRSFSALENKGAPRVLLKVFIASEALRLFRWAFNCWLIDRRCSSYRKPH